jgi:RimJ/RimL family protein N-acetyltransferase
MKTGELIYLRPIEEYDLEQLKTWRNHESFKKYFREYLEISNTQQLNWFNNEVLNNNRTVMFSIVDKISDELIGCCGLTYINWVNRNADFSFYYGRNLDYIDTEGYSIEAAKILLDYGYNQLNMHKIWAEIYEFDSVKKGFLLELGFKLDGELRENYYYDGRYWNSCIYSMLSSEFH